MELSELSPPYAQKIRLRQITTIQKIAKRGLTEAAPPG